MAKVSKREWTAPNGETKSAWVVRWLHGGKHHSKQFDKKKEADAYRVKLEGDIATGAFRAAAASVRVEQACNEFLRASEVRVRDGRISKAHLTNLKRAADISIIPHLGERLMHELTQADIEEFYDRLVRIDGLAPITARERVVKLGQICDFGRAPGRNWLHGRPVDDARRALRGIRSAPVRTFTPEEVLRLLKAADVKRRGQHPRTHRLARCFVHLAAFCGLRYGEIAGLTLQHLDLQSGIIRVRHSLNQDDELKGPKTRAGIRDVDIPKHLGELLGQWISSDYVPNDRNLLFRVALSRSDKGPGGFINCGSFHTTYWRPLLEEAELRTGDGNELHFHALRHFASSWLMANGMPVPDVAAYLGHASFDTTLQIYAHPLLSRPGRASLIGSMASKLLTVPLQIEHAPA